MFEMKEEFKTGIEDIDNQHKRLFDICEEAYQLLKNSYSLDKYDKILAIIDELKNYTKTHFAYEEEYMKSTNYSGIFTQKIQHADFINKLNSIQLKEIDANQDESLMNLLSFAADWLTEHILKEDLRIKKEA